MKNILYYTLGSLLLFSSCFKKNNEELVVEDYSADWALQIINSEFNIADLLDKSDTNNLQIIVDGDDIILSYSEEINTDLTDDYYKLQDQKFIGKHTQGVFVSATGFDTPFPPVSLDLSTTLPNSPLDVNGTTISDANLKEILIDKGDLELTITNTFQHPLVIDLTIPSISNNGQEISFSNITVPPATSVTITKDIDNHIVDLKDDVTGDLNSINIIASIAGTLLGTEDLNIGDEVIFSLTMKDVSYQHIVGQLGTFTIPLDKGENEITLFDDLGVDGEFHIETFNFKSTISTDWGVPLGMTIENLDFFNNQEMTSTGVINGIDDLIEIKALSDISLVGSEMVTTETVFSTDEYPDLRKIMDIRPTSFGYDLNFITNPNSDPSEDLFISKDSKIQTILEGQFYLHGYLKGFSRSDTISNIDLSDEDNSIVEKAIIRFIFENGMPLTLGVDLYFLDEDDNIIDTELDKIKIASANIDANGNAISSTSNTIDVVLSQERMMEIGPEVKKIVMVTKLDTEGAAQLQNVHIRPQDKMKIIIGIRATIDQDLN